MEKIQKAMELAVKYHAGVPRKSSGQLTIPYVFHPFQVAKLVFDWGAGTEINLVVGVTHDLKEDTKITEEELVSVIGKRAYFVVDELSFMPAEGLSPSEKASAKFTYIQSFKTKSVEALIIKLADRICNVMDFVASGDVEYAKKYRDKATDLYYIFDDRKSDIAAFYGWETVKKIRKAIDDMFEASSGKV